MAIFGTSYEHPYISPKKHLFLFFGNTLNNFSIDMFEQRCQFLEYSVNHLLIRFAAWKNLSRLWPRLRKVVQLQCVPTRLGSWLQKFSRTNPRWWNGKRNVLLLQRRQLQRRLGTSHKCYSSFKCKSKFIELFHKIFKSAPKHKR